MIPQERMDAKVYKEIKLNLNTSDRPGGQFLMPPPVVVHGLRDEP